MGLGNPGAPYASTRHNAGFWVLDTLAQKAGVRFRKPFFSPYRWAEIAHPEGRLVLVEPLTYMNRCGDILPDLEKKFHLTPDRLLVVVDQLDLPPGTLRLKSSGGSAGHNGLKSVESMLGTTAYKRLYVGIGRPADGAIIPWVLGTPEGQDTASLGLAVHRASELLGNLPSTPWEKMLTLINSVDPS